MARSSQLHATQPMTAPPAIVEREERVPSWLMSLVLHVIAYVTLLVAIHVWGDAPAGPGNGRGREVSIVPGDGLPGAAPGPVGGGDGGDDQPPGGANQHQPATGDGVASIDEAALARNVGESLDELLGKQPSNSAQGTAPLLGTGTETNPGGLAGGLPGHVGQTGLLGIGKGSGRSGIGPGVGPGSGGGGGGGAGGGRGGTSFFNIEAQGSRFAYVIDHSGSMGTYRQLSAAKGELVASLQTLESQHQFQVIFYNDSLQELRIGGQQPSLNWATESNKLLARQFLFEVVPDGGTDHMAALRKALLYRPEHLFFLTDADEPILRAKDLAEIKRINVGRTRIHCVEFGKGADLRIDNFLKRLAAESGGTYRYRDITEFTARQ